MAKVRKKFNKMKQMGRFADHLLKDIVVAYVDRLEGCVFVDRKKQYIVKPTEPMIGAISRPHKWSCYIAVFGRTAIDEYMKSEVLTVPSKYYQEDLAPIFEEHHLKLMQSVPDHHRCAVGWIADPFGGDISEQEAGNIFTKLEAWS